MPENRSGATAPADAQKISRKGFWRTLAIFFALIGPGIITSNVDNDAGGITTYSLAGSEFGLTLLWTLIPITFALIIVQEMCARMGVVSGKGLSDLIRERFGAKATFYLMIALFFTNLGNTISEFAGVAASLEIFGVSKYFSVPVSAFFVWWLVVKGSYKSIEKVFLVACVFYISYIISGFMVRPDWKLIQTEFLTPTIHFDPHFLTMAVGVVGTTIAPWMQFYLQSSVVDKGLKAEDYQYARMDVILGSVIVNTRLLVDTASHQLTLELTPTTDPRAPDPLVYWSPEAPEPESGAGVPREAVFLGSLVGTRTRSFPLPREAATQDGSLLLYSLGHQSVLGAASLPTQSLLAQGAAARP